MLRHSLVWVLLSAVIGMMFVHLPQIAARQDAVLHTYAALIEVDALARQKFVEPFNDDRLVDGAIRGMMLQLDPYSSFLNADELEALEKRTRGEHIGVGLELGMVHETPTVIAPIENSPASMAGVLPGDTLLSVNGTPCKGMSIFNIEQRLSGPPDSTVSLRMQRAGLNQPMELVLRRETVNFVTVRGFRRDPLGSWDYYLDRESKIGYVRITHFADTTLRDFDEALGELIKAQCQGLIIDLRFNPGGVMTQAVGLVDRFVADGLLLATVTRRRAVQEYMAIPEGSELELPLVVLVNRYSASSSEIVAGSLQDHHRAAIIGERTFGKGSVQHLLPLSGRKAAIKLTVAHYRLPGGRIIHRTPADPQSGSWGVEPDIEVPISIEEEQLSQAARRALDAPSSGASPTRSTSQETHLDSQLRAGVAWILESRRKARSALGVSLRE